VLVIGLAPDKGYVVLDMVRDRLSLGERTDRLLELVRRCTSRWRCTSATPGVPSRPSQSKFILLPYCNRTLYDGSTRDLVYDFVEQEYTAFPVSRHDDMLDALSRICDDKELGLRWPNGPPSPDGGGSMPANPLHNRLYARQAPAPARRQGRRYPPST
jgi:hypothetical protein